MEEKQLVVLATSDLHGDIYSFSYESNEANESQGCARVQSYFDEVRQEFPDAILLDNGDTFQGTIMTDAIYSKDLSKPHPVAKWMNFAKYDCMTLGNHEFNFGLDFIKTIASQVNFPILAANVEYKDVDPSGQAKHFLSPYTILERDGIKIGVLGITNPNIPRWDGAKVEELNFLNIPDTAEKYVKILREKEQVDLLIASVHADWEPEFDFEHGSDGAESILRRVDGIDILILGHQHIRIAKKVNGTMVGMPVNSGRQVLRYDILMGKNNVSGKWKAKNIDLQVVEMSNYDASEKVRELIKEGHERTVAFIQGTSEGENGGVFAYATENFQPPNEIKDIPLGKLQDTPLIELIAQVQLAATGADVTSVSLLKDSSDIRKGEINFGGLFDIYRYNNTLCTVEISGSELKTYMEWAVRIFNTWRKGDISISFSESIPAHLYDMFKGVEYEINLSENPGNRIQNVRYKGEPLKDDENLLLAVCDYRYNSGLKVHKLVSHSANCESSQKIRDMIGDYLKAKGTISPTISRNWKIVGVNLEHPLRGEIIQLVNSGYLEVPYYHSLNVYELEASGIIKNGKIERPANKVKARKFEH